MDPTAIQAGAPPHPPTAPDAAIQAGPPKPPPAAPPPAAPARREKSLVMRALRAVASLRLTVALFVLALLLVFYGTLAQVDNGIWTVVGRYFRCLIAWIPVDVLLLNLNHWATDANGNPVYHLPGSLPYPGGFLLGGLLLVNLLAAHLSSFRFDWKRAGILLIHSGLVVLMLSELFTWWLAVEGSMIIEEGQTVNYVTHPGASELVFERVVSPGQDEVVAVPARLVKAGETLDDPQLPVVVDVKTYMTNSDLTSDPKLARSKENPATAGQGLHWFALPQQEISGVATEQRQDAPSAYVTLRDRTTGKVLNTYLLSVHLDPEWVKLGDREYQLSLRYKRTYRDFSFHLDRFDFKKFVGSSTPKDYRSHIHLLNPSTGEDRKVEIYMNAPLRYEGETFYQASVLQDPRTRQVKGTILQVVRNPGWLLPYISCAMVSLGMLVHFGMNLFRFIERRAAS